MTLIKNIHKSFSDDHLYLNYDRIMCEDSFAYFLEQAWPYIDPNVEYIHGWHIDAICDHLEAVMYGNIRKLLINIPPRTSKSSVVSIAFPAWVWTQNDRSTLCGPNAQFMCASYAQSLSDELSDKFRRLINSEWYQLRWGHRFNILKDTSVKVTNDQGGQRRATSVTGTATGFGGNIHIIDDPHNARESDSKTAIRTVIQWNDRVMSSRFNNKKEGARILVMQRLHVGDLSGHYLSKEDPDLVFLFLPMEFMPDRKCYTVIGFEDPRTVEGELLIPDRFGPKEIRELKTDLGSHGYVGQYQQMPVVEGGGIIKSDYWQLWKDLSSPPPFDMIIASVDTAYTIKQENDYSACTIWGTYKDEHDITRALMIGAWQDRLEFHDLVEKIRKTIKAYNLDKVLVEAKASGLSVIQELDRLMRNSTCSIVDIPVPMDKVARAHSIQGVFEAGYVFAPDTDWAQKVVYECADFPKGVHDDYADSVTQAIRYLRDTVIETREDRQLAMQAELIYTKPRSNQSQYGV